jgi:hypothetical protein
MAKTPKNKPFLARLKGWRNREVRPDINQLRRDGLNTNYRVVWNEATQQWVVASELTKGRKKVRVLAGLAITAALGLAISGQVAARDHYAQAQSVSDALGGGSYGLSDGTVSAPKYDVGGYSMNNVGDALTNLDGRVDTTMESMLGITGQLDSKTSKIDARVTDNAAAISKVDSRVKDNTAALSKVDSRVKDNAAALSKVDSRVKDNATAISKVDSRAKDSAAAISKVDAGVKSNTHQISEIQGRQYLDSATVASALGGGSTATSAGMVTAPEYKVGGTTQSNVGDALANVDGRVSSIASNLDHGVVGAGAQASESSAALGAGANAPAKNSVALGNDSLADRDNSVSVGSEGHERQITNVAPATQRTDAANWGQVQDAIGDVKNWADQRFKKLDRRIDRMGAMTAAYGQMAFSAAGVESPNRVGVGIGTQNGQAALAVGYSHQLSKNLNLSFGAAAASGGDVSVGGGLAVGW